ncbi:MAG: hypothetical protein ACD_3C00082G0009 [uncultured bacterium (gcode 4)]|uniref:Uncharacterized protein n=1 Tax=uncultured bacterium (gcode 4) TaxID=1234023 RepID=K2G216_9BACT|nr:MAG: hypothetical protein ACD_3C00082G0009 [uncultured bacterium (gcode 4)]
MNKKILKIASNLSIISLVLQSMSVYAFIWDDAWLDFFKTIDKWSSSTQMKFIENELEWSAKKINDYIVLEMNYKKGNIIDINKDFTKKELDKITEEFNIGVLLSHLDEKFQSGEEAKTLEELEQIRKYTIIWYKSKEWEMMKKETSMSRIAVSGLYNDWDVNNSWYDIMDDLTKIHNVIFSKETKYEWVENGTSLEFGDILNWSMNNVWSIFDDKKPLDNSLWIINSNWGQNTNSTNWNNATNSWIINPINPVQKLNENKSKSNLCNTWSDLWLLDEQLMKDIVNQLNSGESNTSVAGWKWNSNGETSVKNHNNFWSWATWSWNSLWAWSSWAWGSMFDTFPCSWVFCIEISMEVYTQKLLWGWKSESIEWILDKNLKIINTIAGKSLIQSDMTKNFFSLSILRKLNLPSMVYLWMVVTHLPPPILNLEPKSWKESNEFLDESILESTFKHNWMDYKSQNAFNPDYEKKIMGNCEWQNSITCLWKHIDYKTIYQPYISNTNILVTKIWQSYNSSINDDVAELIGFSNTFKANIEQISTTVVKMNKK